MADVKPPQLETLAGFDEFQQVFPTFFAQVASIINDLQRRVTAGGL